MLTGLAVTATLLLAVGNLSATAATARPAAGTIHLYAVNTALSQTAPSVVLITGAFSDHGTGKHGTWHLTKGTISFNTAKIKAIENSPSFGTFSAASCSFSGFATSKIPIIGGTGAYTGIKGTITVTVYSAEQGSLLKNGKCNEANNAPAVAQDEMVTGSGKVSF